LGMGNNSCLQGRLGHDGKRPSQYLISVRRVPRREDWYIDILRPVWRCNQHCCLDQNDLFLNSISIISTNFFCIIRRLDCPRRSTLRIAVFRLFARNILTPILYLSSSWPS
jgi:hypothetical protein